MTVENKILDLSFPAGEDLTNDQFRWMVLTSTGTVRRPDSETEVLCGVLQNAPESGQAAVVRLKGVTKLQMNAVAANGLFVKAEYVDAADAGKGKTAAAALSYARGIVIDGGAAEDDLVSVLLIGPLPAIATATERSVTTVTTDVTAGARTYTAAEIIGGLILRDPTGANRSDVTPTAAAIVAGLSGAIASSSFEFTIKNTADAAETITLTAGAGVTLSGTMTIAQNNSKRFLAVIDNAGGGAEAVTVYSLGTVVH